MIFNNSYRYNHLEEVLRKSSDAAEAIHQVVECATRLTPVNQFVTPMFYRLFPASSILIRKGCLMMGNPELPTMLVATFSKGIGLYTTEEVYCMFGCLWSAWCMLYIIDVLNLGLSGLCSS